jgi:hypothetical protein
VRRTEKYQASAAPSIQTINVYGVLEPRDGGFLLMDTLQGCGRR